MLSVRNNDSRHALSGMSREPRGITLLTFGQILMALFFGGCASFQGGPDRQIPISSDAEWLLPYAKPDDQRMLSAAERAIERNNIITTRMYLIDLEYHKYESRLIQELQQEGLFATLAQLGLTGTASLIPVAQTDRLLSGIATGLTGADKAYTEKVLLTNAMQQLQIQMRTDRKTQASKMFAKMWATDANGNPVSDPKTGSRTPSSISTYTLAMGLADTDLYYQAGTIGSAVVGLYKTASNAEQKADCSKNAAGPNGAAVNNAASNGGQLATPTSTGQLTTKITTPTGATMTTTTPTTACQ